MIFPKMKNIERLVSVAVFSWISLGFILGGCSSDSKNSDSGAKTITAIAAGNTSLTKLVQNLKATGLDKTLEGAGPFTVFAPTDAAFAAIDSVAASLTTEQLAQILKYHVISGTVKSTDVKNESKAATVNGESVFLTVPGGAVTVNGGAKVTTADVTASNGVVHIIDKVLLPDGFGSIVDAAKKRYALSTLVSAVVTANLAETLSNSGTYTVFAPTNEAFAAIQSTVDNLVKAPSTLANVLLFHTLGTKVLSSTITATAASVSPLFTASNEKISVVLDGTSVKVSGGSTSGATVTEADIVANNGVIHLIDKVLVPTL
jgi:transforming growth factor-beta-induced protein